MSNQQSEQQGPDPQLVQGLIQQMAQDIVGRVMDTVPISLPTDDIVGFPYAHFDLKLMSTRSFKQFQTEYAQEYSYTATLKNPTPDVYLETILPSLSLLFDSLLSEVRQKYAPQDFIRVFITHNLVSSVNIIVGPHYINEMTSQVIIQQVARVIRSNNFIPADNNLVINLAAVRNVKGASFIRLGNVARDLISKRSIITIGNQDCLCLARAIVVGIAHWHCRQRPRDQKARQYYNNIRRKDRSHGSIINRPSRQTVEAKKAVAKAGLSQDTEGCLQDVPRYEKALGVGITVMSAMAQNKRIYMGCKDYEKQIALYHIAESQGGVPQEHFAVITKVNALLGRTYYCSTCDVGYSNKQHHHCKVVCGRCGASDCQSEHGGNVYCPNCHAPCRSQACLQRHTTTERCQQMHYCSRCHACLKSPTRSTSRSETLHQCGESYCSNCETYYLDSHLCSMRATPVPVDDDSVIHRFIFYDIESMQQGDSDHVPNLVVAHSICTMCDGEMDVMPDSSCFHCGSRCNKCSARDKVSFLVPPCSPECGKREVIFSGQNVAARFCEWLFDQQHRNMVVIAHNAKGYDAYFLYHYLIANAKKPNIVFAGSKIMCCTVREGLNIKMLDSLNFLPMPLAALPNSFGLTEKKKGFFPHLYNTITPKPSHLPCLPDMRYYCPESMSTKRRSEFLHWYLKNRDKAFDFHKEMLDYCRSDVNILLSACWSFRKLLLDISGGAIDPFRYVTIASVAMGTFRTCFLPESWEVLTQANRKENCHHDDIACSCLWTEARQQSAQSPLEVKQTNGEWTPLCHQPILRQRFVSSPVALLPPQGYSRRDRFSKQSMQWLNIFQKLHPEAKLQTALSPQGEKVVVLQDGERVRRFKLDGYYKDSTGVKHALEFNGCYFHGCPRCFPRDRHKTKVGDKTLVQRFADTVTKEQLLRNNGYSVNSIWACDFATQLACNMQWRQWAEQTRISDPIDMRDCYYGGRTNALVLHWQKMYECQQAAYVDVCSLYPSVMKRYCYPTGHPVRVTVNFKHPVSVTCPTVSSGMCQLLGRWCPGRHVVCGYFGVVKVSVLPPRRLYHPVLPVKCNGKLMFPLCQSCAARESKVSCSCMDCDRILTGTWCTPELDAALSVGYQVVEWHEVLHWETSSDTLFQDYINTFVRLKTEASGYPRNVVTPQQCQEYADTLREKEGVSIRHENVRKNPGLRTIAKLLLNSLYGKFAQRSTQKRHEFITNAAQLFKTMGDPSKKVEDFHVMSEDVMLVEYSNSPDFVKADPKTNVVISAMCSTYARVELWKVLYSLGRRVLYHDTDSVIYTHVPGDWCPPTGQFLGDLTDELVCNNIGCRGCTTGHHIVEFVSCGPKNYAYRLNSGEVTAKVRGFTLNHSASQVVNLTSMRSSLVAWQKQVPLDTPLVTVATQIQRNRLECRIYTRTVTKQYNVVYNKRVVKAKKFTTRPYGYCKRTGNRSVRCRRLQRRNLAISRVKQDRC